MADQATTQVETAEGAIGHDGEDKPLVDVDAKDGGEGEGKDTKPNGSGQAAEGGDGDGGDKPETRSVEIEGAKVDVPAKVADRLETLQKQLAEATASKAPETYELVVPDALKETVKADAEHPMAKPAMEWAKKHGLSQEAFSELTALFYGDVAAGAESDKAFHAEQETKLVEAFSDGGNLTAEQAKAAAAEVGRWAGALLKPDIENNPALLNELKSVAMTADGVLLLRALRDRTGATNPPKGGGETKRDPMDGMYPTMRDKAA